MLPSEPLELARFYLEKTCLAREPLRRELCRDLDVDPELPARVLERIYRQHQSADPFERIHIGQWRTWMVHGVYVKDARLGHGRNFDIVIPFMNDDLMRTVAGLPVGIKREGLADKAFLKAAQRGVLPAETLAKTKQKFWLPFAEWFRGPWRELLHDALLDRAGFVAGRIDPTTVRRLLSEHQAGADHSRVLWALLFLEFWQKGVRT